MINGKEFAEKMFSEIEDNNEVQEKLYSTGNDELDDLLERAFCEGYEYAQREFGRAERKEGRRRRKERNQRLKELGVKRSDRGNIKAWDKAHEKGDKGYFTYDSEKRRVSEDPEERKQALREQAKKHIPRSAAAMGTYGALTDTTPFGTHGNRLKSAAIGAATGAGAAALGYGLAAAESKVAEKHPEGKIAKRFEKNRDMIKVVEGDMSEEDFAKKYRKKK